MTTTIYTKSNCVQCDMTKKLMTREGIEYAEINLEEDSSAMEMVKGLGYLSAPVVVSGNNHWSGFKADRIKGLKKPR